MSEAVAAKPFYPRKSRLLHLATLLVLCIVNTALAYTTAPDIVNLASIPMPKTDWERLVGAAMTIFISYNFLGFVAASFLSMIPYRSTTYAQRYVKVAFMVMILTQVFFLGYALALTVGVIHPKMIF
jgi:hypothetical protein